jgi:hypothetical protein
MCRRNKVHRNKNKPKFGKIVEFGASRKNHLYGIIDKPRKEWNRIDKPRKTSSL